VKFAGSDELSGWRLGQEHEKPNQFESARGYWRQGRREMEPGTLPTPESA